MAEKPVPASQSHTPEEWPEDPVLDRLVFVFLVIFLLAVFFLPQEWFLKASMWWNGIH